MNSTSYHDIVTVTCSRDFHFMRLQAYTLNKFLIEPCTHYVFIEDKKINYAKWFKMLKPLYTRHKLVILNTMTHPQLLSFRNDPDFANKTSGWAKQQLIKFKIAGLLKNFRYLILDSKNFLVKTIFVGNSFNFAGMGKLTPATDSCFDQWRPWINFCSEQLNKPVPNDLWWPQTPFIADNIVVNSNINKIENLFYQFLQNNHALPSEFIIYRFFMNENITDPEFHPHAFLNSDNNNIDDLINCAATSPWFTIYRVNLRHEKKKELLLDFLNFMGLDEEYTKPALFETDVSQ